MDPLINFRKTLDELKTYLSLPIKNNRDQAGIIQAFEFTFEQSWKAIQKTASSQGVSIASPKTAFSFAMQSGWFPDSEEDKWLQMISDRNLTSHTYKKNLADEILNRIKDEHVGLFENLLKTMEKSA